MASCIIRREWFGYADPGDLPVIIVPDLEGLPEAAATASLGPWLIRGVRSEGPDAVIPEGSISAQIPAAGGEARVGGAVAYTVSTGPV